MTGCTTERHRRVSPPSLIVTTRNRHRRRPRPQAKGPPPCRSRALVPPSATPPPFPPRLSPHGPPSPPGDPRGGVPTQRTRGKPSASTSGPDSPPPPGAVSASTVAASSRSTASRSSASCLTAARDGAGDMASRPMAPGGRVCGTEGAEGGGGVGVVGGRCEHAPQAQRLRQRRLPCRAERATARRGQREGGDGHEDEDSNVDRSDDRCHEKKMFHMFRTIAGQTSTASRTDRPTRARSRDTNGQSTCEGV